MAHLRFITRLHIRTNVNVTVDPLTANPLTVLLTPLVDTTNASVDPPTNSSLNSNVTVLVPVTFALVSVGSSSDARSQPLNS